MLIETSPNHVQVASPVLSNLIYQSTVITGSVNLFVYCEANSPLQIDVITLHTDYSFINYEDYDDEYDDEDYEEESEDQSYKDFEESNYDEYNDNNYDEDYENGNYEGRFEDGFDDYYNEDDEDDDYL